MMAVTSKPWDGSASKYPDTDAYCKACLIDENEPGADKVQALCHLPVYEPNGDLNQNALGPAAGALNGARGQSVKATPASKKKAAKKLLAAYLTAKMDPPASLKNLAS